MFDVSNETLIPVATLTDRFKSRKRGKKLTRQTVSRWIHAGVGGRRLEAVRIGGGLFTTEAAIQRFCEALQ